MSDQILELFIASRESDNTIHSRLYCWKLHVKTNGFYHGVCSHLCWRFTSFLPKPPDVNFDCSVKFIGLRDAVFAHGLESNVCLFFQPTLASLEPIQSQEMQGCREIRHVLLAGHCPGVSKHFNYFLWALQSARLADTDSRYGWKVFFFCSESEMLTANTCSVLSEVSWGR